MSPTPILEARGLRVTRGGRVVLDEVDLVLQRGEVTAVVGDSGAGKSSLLRCVVGLDAIDEGTVRYDGIDCATLDVCQLRRDVAFVAQSPVMLPGTVRGNLAYGLQDPENADLGGAMADVGLDAAMLERPARELSGGETARVALARALVRGPSVLLLDEPTAALDASAVSGFEALLRAQAGRGVAVAIITHDAAQARRIATGQVVLSAGRVAP